MIKSIGAASVMVSDKERAIRWYREKLGFEVEGEGKRHYVLVGPRGSATRIHLCPLIYRLADGTSVYSLEKGKTGAPIYPLEPGNTGIPFFVDDIEAVYLELKRRGVEFTRDITRQEWGTYAMLKDPDGNVFWLVEEKGWEIE